MRAVFGQAFVVLPKFSCDAAARPNSKPRWPRARPAGRRSARRPHLVHARLQVRAPVARLGDCLRGAEVLATGDRLASASPSCRSWRGSAGWVWRPWPAQPMPQSKLSLVLQSAAAVHAAQPLAGVLIDEWTEVVPNARETTAMTFQFDPPDACRAAERARRGAAGGRTGLDTETLRQVLDGDARPGEAAGDRFRAAGRRRPVPAGVYLAFNALRSCRLDRLCAADAIAEANTRAAMLHRTPPRSQGCPVFIQIAAPAAGRNAAHHGGHRQHRGGVHAAWFDEQPDRRSGQFGDGGPKAAPFVTTLAGAASASRTHTCRRAPPSRSDFHGRRHQFTVVIVRGEPESRRSRRQTDRADRQPPRRSRSTPSRRR